MSRTISSSTTTPAALGARCARDRARRQRELVNGECRERRHPSQSATAAPGMDSHRRRSRDVAWGCGFPAMPTAAPANLPPAYPDYSDGVGSVWAVRTVLERPATRPRAITQQRMRGERAARRRRSPTACGPDSSPATTATNAIGIDVLYPRRRHRPGRARRGNRQRHQQPTGLPRRQQQHPGTTDAIRSGRLHHGPDRR